MGLIMLSIYLIPLFIVYLLNITYFREADEDTKNLVINLATIPILNIFIMLFCITYIIQEVMED